MALFVNKFENIFKTKTINLNNQDLQEYVLGKIFPTIRFGRDSDLERYVSLRESGRDSAEWQSFYENLSLKYTEPERKQLIRSMRKNLHHFNRVFSKIISDLYKRVIIILKRRIDLLVKEFHGVEHSSKDHNMLSRVETIIGLCSQNKSEAPDGIRFLADLSQNLGYKHKAVRKIQHLVKSYFDGSLFEEAEAKIEYHFDIKEEYKKQKKLPARPAEDQIKLKIFITEEDIGKILVDRDKPNEYELSFSYFEKYIKFINDPEFATKVYVYSKKHNTPHYHIFESIRKGVTYNYQRNRVFDDIFKIICQGRYVFNISNEKQIDKKLWTIGKPVKPPSLPGRMRSTAAATPLPGRMHPTAAAGPEHRVKPPAPPRRSERAGSVHVPGKRVPADKTSVRRPELKEYTGLRSTHTIEEMTGDLNADKKVQRILLAEFRNRLPVDLTKALGFHNSTALEDEHKVKQLKDLIHYVLHNYESMLSEESMFKAHKDRIEGMGFSLHAIYTVILNSFNSIKSDFLTGELSQKINRSLAKRFKFF